MFKKILKSREYWAKSSTRKPAREHQSSEVLKICHCCYSFKYDGNWHFEEPTYIKEREANEKITVQFTMCPACVEELLAKEEIAEFA